MYIKELEINNFRIYKGENKISLSPNDDKNIIIVSGQNGFGKTTFLMALVWCLYGKNMEKVDAIYKKEIHDNGNYPKYIADCLNRKAKEDGENSFYVKVNFSDVYVHVQGVSCDVEIKRLYNLVRGEQIEVKISGQPQELIENFSNDKQKGEEIFIRDYIMPDAIAKFFFFDAEKITSLAEINQKEQSRELSLAYSEVLGIKKYEDLKNNLEDNLDIYRKKSAGSQEKQQLNNLAAEISNKEIEEEECETQIQNLQEENQEKKQKVSDISTLLIRAGEKMSQKEIDELRADQQKFEDQKSKAQNDLKNLYENLPFAIAGEKLSLVSEQIQNERLLHNQKFKHNDVKEKTIKILQEIEEEKQNTQFVLDVNTRKFFETQIEKLIEKYFYTEEAIVDENLKPLHDFSENQANELTQLVHTIKSDFKNKFEQIHNQFSIAKNESDKVNRKLLEAERNSEDEKIQDLRIQKLDLENEISKNEQKIGALKNQIEALKADHKKLKQDQTEIRKKIDEAAVYSAKEKKTRELINTLDKFILKFKQQKKESLETKMLSTIKQLFHKQDFVQRVEVNILSSDYIDINLFDKNDNVINKSGLSMGERQLYASALLGSLESESEIEFPVFIDSPMQKFDKQHSDNIIKYFYPNVSKQVVIFPLLHTELRKDNYELLRENVSKTFLINNITPDSSEFKELTPNDFFETIK